MSALNKLALCMSTASRFGGRRLFSVTASQRIEQRTTHRNSEMDKKKLVWAKLYPSVEEVPDEISQAQMRVAKDWFRVRSSIVTALVFIIGAVFWIKLGRDDRNAGETLMIQGNRYVAQQQEIGRQQRAAESQAEK